MDSSGQTGAPTRPAADPPAPWRVVEIFGKRQHVGIASEVERFGVKMMRLEALQTDGSFVTMFYGGAAIFGDHEVSEEAARNLVVPRRSWTCQSFKAPSARPGHCAECGREEAEHGTAPQLPSGGDDDARFDDGEET